MGRILLVGLIVAAVLVPLLGWLASKVDDLQSQDPLTIALLDRNGTVEQLVRELSAQPASAAIDALLQRLQGSADQVDRLGANWRDIDIIALLEPETSLSLEPLSQALATIRDPDYVDSHVRARMDAASAMGLQLTPPRTKAMLAVLKEKREPKALRAAIVESLSSNGDPVVVAALDQHWYADTSRFAPQSSAPRGESLAMRRARVSRLQKEDTAEADAALLAALKDPDPEIRASAAWGLKGRSGNRIRDALIALINPNEHYTVVYMVLAAIDGCPTENYLTAWLNTFSSAPELQNLALTALVRCNDHRIVPPIVASLDQRQTALGLRAANALASLAYQQHQQAIAPLQQALQSNTIAAADKAEIERALERLVSKQAAISH